MNYSSETINKLYYGNRLINISVTNGGGGGIPMPSNLSAATLNDYGLLTSAAIKSGVTSIGDDTFASCTSLSSVTIPNSVTSIGKRAFYSCTSLSSVTIPNSVTSIGERAFYSCKGLTSVAIHSGVTSIGERAFYSCISLSSVTVEAITPPTLGSFAFNGSHCQIYVPSASVNAYKAATNWSTYADRIQAIP